MSNERRQYERFPLKLTSKRFNDNNKPVEFQITELSVGGCFAEQFAEASPGYTFRIEIPLVNGNWLPLTCRVRYRYMAVGIGVQFVNITHVEQRLIAELIIDDLKKAGLPALNPFAPPKLLESQRTSNNK